MIYYGAADKNSSSRYLQFYGSFFNVLRLVTRESEMLADSLLVCLNARLRGGGYGITYIPLLRNSARLALRGLVYHLKGLTNVCLLWELPYLHLLWGLKRICFKVEVTKPSSWESEHVFVFLGKGKHLCLLGKMETSLSSWENERILVFFGKDFSKSCGAKTSSSERLSIPRATLLRSVYVPQHRAPTSPDISPQDFLSSSVSFCIPDLPYRIARKPSLGSPSSQPSEEKQRRCPRPSWR